MATQRHIPVEKVLPVADGRVLSGEQAKELGLIDSFGNFTDAVSAAAKLGGLKDKEPELIYPEEDTFSFTKLFPERRLRGCTILCRGKVPFLSYEWTTTH